MKDLIVKLKFDVGQNVYVVENVGISYHPIKEIRINIIQSGIPIITYGVYDKTVYFSEDKLFDNIKEADECYRKYFTNRF